MRNKSYVKRGIVIEVQIKEQYFAAAYVIPVDKEKTSFKCNLSIHDNESGFSEELDESFTLSSTCKTSNADVATKLNEMIDTGCFDESVENIKNMLECLDALLEFQNRLREEK